jgi:hypothetical protein
VRFAQSPPYTPMQYGTLTASEALSAARDWWGERAAIMNLDDAQRCVVGEVVDEEFIIRGRGRTWDEALKDALDDLGRAPSVTRLPSA